MKTFLLATSLLIIGSVHAADWKPIQGSYAITSKNNVDNVRDSHFKMQLKGNSARDLYNAIKLTPVTDKCTNALAKNIGDMQCLYYAEEKKYECHFAINIMQQKIEFGVSC